MRPRNIRQAITPAIWTPSAKMTCTSMSATETAADVPGPMGLWGAALQYPTNGTIPARKE